MKWYTYPVFWVTLPSLSPTFAPPVFINIHTALNFNEIKNGFLFSRNLIETFLKKGSFNTGGSINTDGSIYTGGSFSTSRLDFHIPDIQNRETFFCLTFKKSLCLGDKNSHFWLVYGKVYKKISISLLFHVRGNRSFSGRLNWATRIKRDSPPPSYL